MQRNKGLYDALKPLRGRLKSVRFITEISSINEYGNARTDCIDEFNCVKTDKFPSILDLRPEGHDDFPSLAEKLSMLPAPYCIFTHFHNGVTHKSIPNIPAVRKSVLELLLDQDVTIREQEEELKRFRKNLSRTENPQVAAKETAEKISLIEKKDIPKRGSANDENTTEDIPTNSNPEKREADAEKEEQPTAPTPSGSE